jgi:hypothetical protein
MRGSWSVKAVLPTLGVPGYDELGEIRSGTDAQAGYLETIDPDTSSERREALRLALLAYCERDTEAMMIVLDRLTRPAATMVAIAEDEGNRRRLDNRRQKESRRLSTAA